MSSGRTYAVYGIHKSGNCRSIRVGITSMSSMLKYVNKYKDKYYEVIGVYHEDGMVVIQTIEGNECYRKTEEI